MNGNAISHNQYVRSHFDRHHLHRMTTLGYEGGMYMLTTLVNAVLERLDDDTRGMGTTDYNHDLIR